jgi:hypothetical protein
MPQPIDLNLCNPQHPGIVQSFVPAQRLFEQSGVTWIAKSVGIGPWLFLREFTLHKRSGTCTVRHTSGERLAFDTRKPERRPDEVSTPLGELRGMVRRAGSWMGGPMDHFILWRHSSVILVFRADADAPYIGTYLPDPNASGHDLIEDQQQLKRLFPRCFRLV